MSQDDVTGIADELTVELVKGPDPDEWGEAQTVAPDPEAPTELPEGVKGPDPGKWGNAQAGILATD